MPKRSERLDRIPPYLFAQISQIKREAVAGGADLIDLGIGDPDRPTPQGIRDALATSAQNPETHRYDETPLGWPAFLEAAAEWYARQFGVDLDPASEVMQVIGSKEGLAHLVWAYADPSDAIILPSPGYPVYRNNALMVGAEIHSTPLNDDTGWLPDLSAIPTDVAKRAKLFFACYPSNPTGAVATPEHMVDLVAFCREHDILLAIDMAYGAVTYDGFVNPTALQVQGGKDVTIEFHSLSKTFNMTGWRLGFAAGSPDALATLQSMKDQIDSKQFPAIAEAGAAALRGVSNQDTFDLYRKRREILCDGLGDLGWHVPKPKAGFFVWTRVPRQDMTSADFCAELLKTAHIVAVPGSGYGPEGEGYVRFSLTLPGDRDGERFVEAVRRIRESGILG